MKKIVFINGQKYLASTPKWTKGYRPVTTYRRMYK